MGKIKYSLLRNTFNIILSGGTFPKYNYMFRIDTIKVFLLMQHIQEKLLFKAGRLHNIIISGHKFKNVPVYERGGKRILLLFKEYQYSLPEK